MEHKEIETNPKQTIKMDEERCLFVESFQRGEYSVVYLRYFYEGCVSYQSINSLKNVGKEIM